MNPLRVRAANDAPLRPDGDYVLYWMIAARRTTWSHALDRALALATELGRPLLIFEPLRAAYPWASERLHTFAVQGMVDNAAACAAAGVSYRAYVEPVAGEGRGLLEALAARACAVVTDTFPCFFLPDLVSAAARKLSVRLEEVDGNGVLPLRAADRAFTVAHSFRRHMHRCVRDHLRELPEPTPLRGYALGPARVPAEVDARWPATDPTEQLNAGLRRLGGPSPAPMRGGARAAEAAMRTFLERRLERYAEERNEPSSDAASGLSPWLHFGHLSAQEVVATVLRIHAWRPEQANLAAVGVREGFWGLPAPEESFLDELITWRELGYGWCFHDAGYDRFDTLPMWALDTLAKHGPDRRPYVYTLDQLDASQTHDPLWNAAQRQLRAEGRIHNYLRMVWGKKVLEWSPTPEIAWQHLIELNNRYAVDGRDPNSYCGISWTFGRFDRAWGPERPIFGTVRYMSSDNTARKVDVKPYLARWGGSGPLFRR